MIKTLLPALALSFAACVAPPTSIPVTGAVQRTVERVLERHDLYVGTDPDISMGEMESAMVESSFARALMIGESVPADLARAALAPILERHDAYVASDPGLDPLERAIHLADTERLRGLLDAVPSAAVPAS